MNLKPLLFIALLICNPAFAKETITIFAAASLTSPLSEIAHQIEESESVKIVLSFASSSTLARQISQGAPADLIISANPRWLDYLEKGSHLQRQTRTPLLHNRLVIATQIETEIPKFKLGPNLELQQLGVFTGRIALGDPNHVPVGIYAKQALEHLSLWDRWKDELAPMNSARSALALTERGETLLGIHYYTDTYQNPKLKVVSQIPPTSHSPITYEVAMITSADTPAITQVYNALFGQKASQVFKRYGFTTAEQRK